MFDFFPRGAVPCRSRMELFFQQVSQLRPRDEIYLAKAIAGLSPSKLADFASRVIPDSKDERLLRHFFQNPGVHRKMDLDAISLYLRVIREMEFRGSVTRDFYEEMATSLVQGYSNGGSILSCIYEAEFAATQMRVAKEFNKPDFDLALSRHIAAADLTRQGEANFVRSWSALQIIELPATLEAYLVACNANNRFAAEQLTAQLVSTRTLPKSYIGVFRRVLGDETFIQVVKRSLDRPKGIDAVADLTPIFGEAAFHDESFLARLRIQLEAGEVPVYLSKFRAMGFDEARLPLLAAFMLEYMGLAITFNPENVDMGFAVELAGLARRKGFGVNALSVYIQAIATAFDLPTEAQAVDIVNNAYQASRAKEFGTHRKVYGDLLRVVTQVGLESLQVVAPGVNAGFVMECLEKQPSALTKREIMRMFPQTKGSMLENDLGL